MSLPASFKLDVQSAADLADLIVWLRRCPSRHRHLLFMLDSGAWQALLGIESSSRELAEKVEALLAKHTDQPIDRPAEG